MRHSDPPRGKGGADRAGDGGGVGIGIEADAARRFGGGDRTEAGPHAGVEGAVQRLVAVGRDRADSRRAATAGETSRMKVTSGRAGSIAASAAMRAGATPCP